MSAKLRLSASIPQDEKDLLVNNLLEMLRLTGCADTIIGSPLVKGISGGERKRTALAMEMVTSPGILFLDEPTSGLDTFSASNVVEILKNLAISGKTVVSTIHQPSSDIFHMFDDLCLLAEGKIVYLGPVSKVVHYFTKLGYPCPSYTNPADYLFMSVLNKNRISAINSLSVSQIIEAWNGSEENSFQQSLVTSSISNETGFNSSAIKGTSSFSTQFNFLLGRAFKNSKL
jgi:ABC-type multidrug transport system ATPase subunit